MYPKELKYGSNNITTNLNGLIIYMQISKSIFKEVKSFDKIFQRLIRQ
jgi:hypothetical protein